MHAIVVSGKNLGFECPMRHAIAATTSPERSSHRPQPSARDMAGGHGALDTCFKCYEMCFRCGCPLRGARVRSGPIGLTCPQAAIPGAARTERERQQPGLGEGSTAIGVLSVGPIGTELAIPLPALNTTPVPIGLPGAMITSARDQRIGRPQQHCPIAQLSPIYIHMHARYRYARPDISIE